MRRFRYDCVNARNLTELSHIVDNHIDITYRTFLKHVHRDDFQTLCMRLGYDKDFPIKNDWHVGYHRSRYRGKWIYFLTHSCIEYVFK